MKNESESTVIVGVPLSEELLRDMEFLRERVGLKSHLVDSRCLFQGEFIKEDYLKHEGSIEHDFRKAVELIRKYSKKGFVFTDENGELIGYACTVPRKQSIIEQGLLKENKV